MIALDTNVLVRLVLRDNEAQAQRARKLLEAHANSDASLFVSDVVLAEFAWVLRSRYALPDEAIAQTLRAMLDSATLAYDIPFDSSAIYLCEAIAFKAAEGYNYILNLIIKIIINTCHV